MTDVSKDDDGAPATKREEHLDAETIAEDAAKLFGKKGEGPPEIVPDAPPSPDDPAPGA
jgi:hypothetical protein